MPRSLDEVALIGLADEVDVPWLDDPLCESEAPVLRSAEGERVPCPLLHRVLVALREERIRHCVLRDPREIVAVPGCTRLDVLVHPRDVVRLAGVLELLGLVRLPARGRRRFFLAYEGEGDVWWKLAVTSSSFFDHTGSLLAGLARTCLARRQDRAPFFVPSPEDELIAVLLRLALGHEELSASCCRQLQELALRVRDPAHLEAALDMLWLPRTDVRAFLRRIREGDWPSLLAQRQEVARRLRSRAPLRWRLRRLAGRRLRPLARRLQRGLPGALAVAVSGSARPAGFGRELSRRLYGEARCLDVGPPPEPDGRAGRCPSLTFLARRWGRGVQARWHRRRGRFVVLDRYPDRAGPRDGAASWLRRLRSLLEAGTGLRPDLILTLAPREEIAPGCEPGAGIPRKGARTQATRSTHPPETAWLDATQDPQVVLREAMSCIWRAVQRHRRGEVFR